MNKGYDPSQPPRQKTFRAPPIWTNHAKRKIKSESAFLLMKLACSRGEPFIKKFLEHDIIIELVKMMQCTLTELQDSAYTALHNMLFSSGGGLVVNQTLQASGLERLVHSMESESPKN